MSPATSAEKQIILSERASRNQTGKWNLQDQWELWIMRQTVSQIMKKRAVCVQHKNSKSKDKKTAKGSSTPQQQTNLFTDRHGCINQHNWSKTYKRIRSTKVKKDKEPKLIPCGGGDPLKRYGTLRIHVETKTKHDICKLHLIEGTYGSLPNSYCIRSGIGTMNKQTQESY